MQATTNLDVEINFPLSDYDREVAVVGLADAGSKRRRGPEATSGGGGSVDAGRPARGLKRQALLMIVSALAVPIRGLKRLALLVIVSALAALIITRIAIYTGVNDFYPPSRENLHPLYAFLRLFKTHYKSPFAKTTTQTSDHIDLVLALSRSRSGY